MLYVVICTLLLHGHWPRSWMYSQYGIAGGIAGLVANMLYVGWIYFSYVRAFTITAEKYKLNQPKVF